MVTHILVLLFRISIHAAREGGDGAAEFDEMTGDISIHAAREGGDVCLTHGLQPNAEFQSTPPVKAATTHGRTPARSLAYFNPRRP